MAEKGNWRIYAAFISLPIIQESWNVCRGYLFMLAGREGGRLVRALDLQFISPVMTANQICSWCS